MWGFGSARATTTTTAASTRKDRAASSKRPSTSNSLFDDEAIHHDYNDDELNDPALLAELAALSGGIPASSHRTDVHDAPRPTRALPPPSTTNESVDPQHQIYMPVSHDEEVHVDFTDDDMNDPNLLAELHQIHGPSDSVSAPASGGQDLFEDKDDESHLADAISLGEDQSRQQEESRQQGRRIDSLRNIKLLQSRLQSLSDPTTTTASALTSSDAAATDSVHMSLRDDVGQRPALPLCRCGLIQPHHQAYHWI
ncbi:hypothetical protein BASA60_008391 [Batrachochytrium salamandrivorans]|nr:hypothetical protein BASA60_008391 [Batrachochytrium salamandrivorans]